jgi:hypothetical protein
MISKSEIELVQKCTAEIRDIEGDLNIAGKEDSDDVPFL